MLQNSLDIASQCRWTMTQSVLQKQPKTFGRERSGLLRNGASQSPDLNPIEREFHLLKTKLKGKIPHEQAGTEDSCSSITWQSITRDETQRLVMSMRSRLQAVMDCKRILATKYWTTAWSLHFLTTEHFLWMSHEPLVSFFFCCFFFLLLHSLLGSALPPYSFYLPAMRLLYVFSLFWRCLVPRCWFFFFFFCHPVSTTIHWKTNIFLHSFTYGFNSIY